MRQKIVAGNWKMNKNIDEAMELALSITEHQPDFPSDVKVIIAPPSLYLAHLEMMKTLTCEVAAQNCSHHDYGAFTGEISAAMLRSMNVKYCIVGHSERRQYFDETNELLKKKVDACLRNEVTPIFCIGELLEERKNNKHFVTVLRQLEQSLFHLHGAELEKIIIAYEPVWAIGTGVTASNEEAQEMHAFIREQLGLHAGEGVAQNISILYGGSVNAANSAELFACKDVDGGLVGGASLKAKDFAHIIEAAG